MTKPTLSTITITGLVLLLLLAGAYLYKQKHWDRYETNALTIAQRNELKKSKKLSEAYYFYDGQYALAYKKVFGACSGAGIKYYYINKNGDEVTKLKFWDKAEPFDDTGFAKVYAGEDYLLDTFGKQFRVAYNINQLNSETTALDLREVPFTSFPTKILSQRNLQVLILDRYSFTRITVIKLPNTIKNLDKLICLSTKKCYLERIPPEIGQLKHLTKLSLQSNLLYSLPPELGQLKNLRSLDISKNVLCQLPEELSQLRDLIWLNLSENAIRQLPTGIGQLKKLTYLNLFRNKITQLPPEIRELKNLTELNLATNDISQLPPEIRELKNLTVLNLAGNLFQAATDLYS